MAFLAKPIFALGFGLFFLCAVTCAHFDQITTSPLSIGPDWAVGVFLAVAGLLSRRDWANGYAYQVAAWAALASLLFGSVVGNFEEWRSDAPDGGTAGLVSMSQESYVTIVGLLFIVALGGLIASLRARNSAPH